MLLRDPSVNDEDDCNRSSTLSLRGVEPINAGVEPIADDDEYMQMGAIRVDDEQTRLLVKLLQAASRYSSLTMSERLKAKKEALRDMQRLMKEIQKDLVTYKEMATEFTAIVKDFTREVSNLQREASRLFHHLQAVDVQLTILVDLLLDDKQPLTDIKAQNDFNECLDMIQELGDIEKFSETASNRFSYVPDDVNAFQKNHLEPARAKLIRREALVESITNASTAGVLGSAVAGAVGGGLVAAPILGGAGALVIASFDFPPILAIGGCMLVGFLAIGAIGLGISELLKKYHKHHSRSVQYLERLSELCDQMKAGAEFMMEESTKLCTDSNVVKNNMEALKRGLQSECQRRGHLHIYRQCKEKNRDLMETLQEIMDFKMEPLENVQRILSSNHRRAIR